MKTPHHQYLALAAFGFLATALQADVLELKNGTVLNGTYTGGTAATIRFETSAGLQVIETSQALALTFTGGTAAPSSAATATTTAAAATTTSAASSSQPSSATLTQTAAPAPAPVAGPVTAPTGTLLLVRMVDGISSKNKAGTTFSTKLEYDLIVNGTLVAKAGTPIYGKVQSSSQARRAVGKSTLDIRLTQISTAGGPVTIATSPYQEAGDASIKKVAKAAAVGAVIGNNTGNGSSSDGAMIGAGVAMLKPGQTLTVAPGTLIEFTLTQPVTLNPAK